MIDNVDHDKNEWSKFGRNFWQTWELRSSLIINEMQNAQSTMYSVLSQFFPWFLSCSWHNKQAIRASKCCLFQYRAKFEYFRAWNMGNQTWYGKEKS